MIRGVPPEMHSMLLNKKSAKEAWEAIKSMRLGAKRVKEVNAQKLLAEFEAIAFKMGKRSMISLFTSPDWPRISVG
jgi:hypothetical protein